MSANALQIAPSGLADSVVSVVISRGAEISISTSTLIQGAIKVMFWTKFKTALATGVAGLLVAGIALIAVESNPRARASATVESDLTRLQGTWSGQEMGRDRGDGIHGVPGNQP
jgi:hypothetical protein